MTLRLFCHSSRTRLLGGQMKNKNATSSRPRLTMFKLQTQFSFKARFGAPLKPLIFHHLWPWPTRPLFRRNFKARPPRMGKSFLMRRHGYANSCQLTSNNNFNCQTANGSTLAIMAKWGPFFMF